jgi:hypothetical protein
MEDKDFQWNTIKLCLINLFIIKNQIINRILCQYNLKDNILMKFLIWKKDLSRPNKYQKLMNNSILIKAK